jgi:hypothetical protein
MTTEPKDPFALLQRLRDENPRVSKQKLLELFWAAVKDDEGYQRAIVEECVKDFQRQRSGGSQ